MGAPCFGEIQREVEQGVQIRSVKLDGALPFVDRVRFASGARQDDAQGGMRAAKRWLELERLAQGLFSCRKIPRLKLRDSDVLVPEPARWIDVDDVVECGQGVGTAAGELIGVAERDERVRIVAGVVLEQRDRAAAPAPIGEILPELVADLALCDAAAQR